MNCSPEHLEIAESIKAICSNPLFKAEGDQLVIAVKLVVGSVFDDAVKGLVELKRATADMEKVAGYGGSGYALSTFHAEITLALEQMCFKATVGELWLALRLEGHIDPNAPCDGIWERCDIRH